MSPETVLFVCVHNAGRSQMAETLFNDLARERNLPVTAESAGTIPGAAINPIAKQLMAEIGHPMDQNTPKVLTQPMVDRAIRVVTMGCGVDAAACPARIIISEDWGLDDPAGQPIEKVKDIRDQIVAKVEELITELEQRR